MNSTIFTRFLTTRMMPNCPLEIDGAHARRFLYSVGLLLCTLLLTTSPLFAAPGDLDPDFGEGGKVITLFKTGEQISDDFVGTALLQPDGKLLIAGGAREWNSSYASFVLARYNNDGTPDLSFGDGGQTLAGRFICNFIETLALQDDGKILAYGTAGCQGPIRKTFMRFTPDGLPDESFGVDGVVDYTDTPHEINQIAALSNNAILLAGTTVNGEGRRLLFITRLLSTGLPDASFGTDGVVTFPIGNGDAAITALQTLSDQTMVTSGYAATADGSPAWFIARHYADGTLDTAFGTAGMTLTPLATQASAPQLVHIATDNTIVIGEAIGTTAALLRYTSTGTLDETFNDAGLLEIMLPPDIRGADLAIQVDAKILIAGTSASDEYALLRFESTGVLDTTFDNDGIASTAVYPNARTNVGALVLAPGGTATVVGDTLQDFAAVRFLGNGALDSTFDGDGVVRTDIGTPLYGSSRASAVAAESTGKAVVGGDVSRGFSSEGFYDSDLVIARYLYDGQLDPTFGNNGVQFFDQGEDVYDSLTDLLTLANGSYLAIGNGYDSVSGTSNQFLLQLNTDGIFNDSFGTNGVVLRTMGTELRAAFNAATIQADGKIVVVGELVGNDGVTQLLALRYLTDGQVDTTFGDNGQVIFAYGTDTNIAGIAASMQPDGKVLIALEMSEYDTTLDDYLGRFAATRLNSDGTVDTSFGTDGVVVRALSNTDLSLSALGLQDDGAFVLAGTAYDYDTFIPDFMIVRYLSDGTVDSSFGTDGVVIKDLGNTNVANLKALAIQPNGKLVTTGYIWGTDDNEFITGRFNTDGSVDNTFGSQGFIQTVVGDPAAWPSDQASDLIIQSDGKILVVGTDQQFVGSDVSRTGGFALVRYLGDPVNQAPTANDQSVTTDEDTPVAITLTATDPNNDSLAYTIITPPQHGTLSGNAPNLTYTPAANYNGGDSFTFQVNDGTVDSNLATVIITIDPVTDVPVAPLVTISQSGADIVLSWSDDEANQGYELHRSTTPYFTPDASTLLDTLSDATTTYTDVGAVNGVEPRYFYSVRAVADGQGAASPQVGMITYPLNNNGEQYTLIGVPFADSSLTTAADVAARIGNVTQMLKWNVTAQTFRFFSPPASGDNFAVAAGDALFVAVAAGGPTSITLVGDVAAFAPTLTAGGYNFITLPLNQADLTTASAYAAAQGTLGALLRWNEATQSFQFFVPPASGDDFALYPGMGFVVAAE